MKTKNLMTLLVLHLFLVSVCAKESDVIIHFDPKNQISIGPGKKQIVITHQALSDGVDLILPDRSTNTSDSFSIPFIVNDFLNVESFQFPVTWDTTQLEFVKIHSLTKNLPDFNSVNNFNLNIKGQLRCVYFSFNDQIKNFNQDTLFYLQLRTIGNACDVTQVIIPDSVPNIDNSSFGIEVTKNYNNINRAVETRIKNSKITLNTLLCPPCDTEIEMVQGVECILPKVISTGEILYPCEYTNGAAELPDQLGYKAKIAYDPFTGSGCFSFCLQGTGVSIGCVESVVECDTEIEMVQGVECILPKVISTGEILYPCEYTNGAAELPDQLGYKAKIAYDPFTGSGCFSFCLQGTPVSVVCVESNAICDTEIEMVQGVECILPKVISTGEILYPCEYTNGAAELPDQLGYKAKIAYTPYEGSECFTFCLQGTPVSIGCTEKNNLDEILCIPCVKEHLINNYSNCDAVYIDISDECDILSFTCEIGGFILTVVDYFEYKLCQEADFTCEPSDLLSLFNSKLQDFPSCFQSGTSEAIYERIQLVPNPATDFLSISKIDFAAVDVINLYDLNGNILRSISDLDNTHRINISDLQAGIYVIHIRLADGTKIVRKIIKI